MARKRPVIGTIVLAARSLGWLLVVLAILGLCFRKCDFLRAVWRVLSDCFLLLAWCLRVSWGSS